jgi:predicted nucleic acid-binding protein
MNILNFLDANVWLALLWSRHIHSEKARAWFERSSEEKFFFYRITQITVLRLLTTQMVMRNDADAVFEKTECHHAPDGKHDVRAMVQTRQARANLITESAGPRARR